MVSQRVPNITATSPDVGGTVDSHRNSPVDRAEESVLTVDAGIRMNTTIDAARAA